MQMRGAADDLCMEHSIEELTAEIDSLLKIYYGSGGGGGGGLIRLFEPLLSCSPSSWL